MATLTLRRRDAQVRFWDRIAERYARKPVPDQAVYESKLTRTSGYLSPTDRVLEVGCGTGTTALHHAGQVTSVHAVDASAKMIEIARSKAAAVGADNVTFEVGSVEQLSVGADPYDVVLAHSLLHLVADVPTALRRLMQNLRPGGHLIMSVPCLRDSAAWLRYIGPLGSALGLWPRVTMFSEATFMEWLEDAGFETVERWAPSPRRGLYLVARKVR